MNSEFKNYTFMAVSTKLACNKYEEIKENLNF